MATKTRTIRGEIGVAPYLTNIEQRAKQHSKELASIQKMTKQKVAGMDIVLIELFNQEFAESIQNAAVKLSPSLCYEMTKENKGTKFRRQVEDLSKTLKAYQSFMDGVVARLENWKATCKKLEKLPNKQSAQADKLADECLSLMGPKN